MGALLQTQQQPLLIQLPNGQLVPAAGGALVDAGNSAPIAADADNTGTLAHGIPSASNGGALVSADAPNSNILRMPAPKGGPARDASLIPQPRQPAPLQDIPQLPNMAAPAGQTGGPDIDAIIKSLSSAAGSGGDGSAPTSVTPVSAPSPHAGVLDQIKNFLGVSTSAPQVPDATSDIQNPGQNTMPQPVRTAALGPIDLPDQGAQPTAGALGAAQPGVAVQPVAQPAPPPVAPPTGALAASVPAPAVTTPPDAPSVPVQNAPVAPPPAAANDTGAAAQPDLMMRLATALGRKPQLNDDPQTAQTMADRYGSDYQAPDFFDRLKQNPIALALLTGGLGTMAAASKPGATLGGSIGQGALGGIQGVYQEREADRAADRADMSAAALADYQRAHGQAVTTTADANSNLAGAKAGAIPEQTAARTTTANAATTRANADTTKANAAVTRANAFASGAGKGGSVFQQKQAAWMAAHPNDTQGALDYAGGRKKMSPEQINASAYRLAEQENSAKITPDGPDVVNRRAAEIAAKIAPINSVAAKPDAGGALGAAAGGPPPVVNKAASLANARQSIQNGADPTAVKQRLKSAGIDPGEL